MTAIHTKTNEKAEAQSGIVSSDWFAAHAVRWLKMEHAGWFFQSPKHRIGQVGIIMSNGATSATFWMPRKKTLAENHAIILEYCEAFHSANK